MPKPLTDDLVLLSIEHGIATLTLNNVAKRNALDPDMVVALNARLDEVWAVRSQLKGLLLCAAGDHFMVGGNINYFVSLLEGDGPDDIGGLVADFNRIVARIDTLPFPVLAFVQGAVAGAGLSLALACDMIIAADDARFVMAYGALGTTPDGGGSWSLQRRVGQQMAMHMFLFNEPLDARQALTHGLIVQCVPRAELLDTAKTMGHRLASGSRGAQNGGKSLIRTGSNNTLEAALKNEEAKFIELTAHDDFKEGVTAFVQKRPPSFTR